MAGVATVHKEKQTCVLEVCMCLCIFQAVLHGCCKVPNRCNRLQSTTVVLPNKFRQEREIVVVGNKRTVPLTGLISPTIDLRLIQIGMLISCAACSRSNAAGT